MRSEQAWCGLSIRAWLVLVGTVLLVRAPFLFYFGFSVDAYFNAPKIPWYSFLASQGRPGSYLLFRLINSLGLYGPIPQYASVLLSLLLLCVAAVLLWRTIVSPRQRYVPVLIVGAVLFLAHPYNSEILTFRDAVPVYAVSTVLGVGGYYLGVVRGRFLTAILLMSFAFSIYQTVVNFLAIAWVLAFLLARIDVVRLKRALRSDLGRVASRGWWLVLVSLVTYLVAVKLLNLATHTHQDGRATFIALSEIPERSRQALLVVKRLLAGDMIAKARGASAITVLLWLAGFAICLRDGRSTMRFIWVPLAFVLSCLAGIGVVLIGHDFGAPPRVLVGIALLPAFGGMSILLYVRQPRWRRILCGVLGVLLISYTGISATVAADQVRVNRRDRLMAAALQARMPLAPYQHIAVVRGPATWYGISTQREFLNMSAYWADWSKAASLSEFYGYPVQEASSDEFTRADAYCRTAPLWPAVGSTRVLDGDLAVVCMGRPAD